MKTIRLPVRALLASLLISFFATENVTHAQAPEPTLNPGFKAEPLVSNLFKAIRENDFHALYNMDFAMQVNLRQMQSDGPQFLADKKLQEDYQRQLSNFKSGSSDFTPEIVNFTRLNADTKIVETHARLLDNINYPKMWVHDIYTSLKFKSTESAPFVRRLNAFDNPQNQILRETVMNFIFSDSGYFMSVARVPETDVTFTNIPFQILAAQIRPGVFKNAFLLGGTPPFTTDVSHNGYITVSDAVGHTDRCSFIIPQRPATPDNPYPSDIFMFIKPPWCQKDLYLTVGLLDRADQVYKLLETSALASTTDTEGPAVVDRSSATTSTDKGWTKLRQRDYAGAITDFNEAITLNPKVAGAYEGRGIAKNALKDYPGALADFNKAIELFPKFAPTYNNRGNTKFALKDFQGAIVDYTHALELNPKDAVYFDNRGSAKKNLEDYDGAISDYTQALGLNDTNGTFYDHRAIAKLYLRDYYAAIADFTQAIGLNPTDGMLYDGRGIAKAALNDYSGAISDCTEGIALNPKAFLFYDHRAQAKSSLKDYDGAVADYIKSIDMMTAQSMWINTWRSTMRQFLGGTIAESEFLNSAVNSGENAHVKINQLCQANYYAGIKRLLSGDTNGGMALFKKCTDSGQTNLPTFKSAETELKLLKNEPQR